MDWYNALFSMTPQENLENMEEANVKGYKKSKLLISKWSAYSNAKKSLSNSEDKGHIFEGQFKPFTPEDIIKVMRVYIIDGLAPSPMLVQKM